MRIAYFVPGPLSCGPLGPQEVLRRQDYLSRHAFPGTEVVVRETPAGPASVESSAEEQLAVPGLLEALPGLCAEGFEGVIIGCFGDPGLAAARELVDIPVVGPGQASAHLAVQIGDRFGILTVVDPVVPSIRRQMRTYGLEAMLADVRAVDVPVLELREREDEVLATLQQEGNRAVRAGADVLILGCMTMGFLDVAPRLQARLEIPIINPVLAALKSLEGIVGIGLSSSRRSYPTPRKEPCLSGAVELRELE
ncbi:MAG: aspartate/glutamate racemase family protein [Gemmatimonadota bacterium]